MLPSFQPFYGKRCAQANCHHRPPLVLQGALISPAPAPALYHLAAKPKPPQSAPPSRVSHPPRSIENSGLTTQAPCSTALGEPRHPQPPLLSRSHSDTSASLRKSKLNSTGASTLVSAASTRATSDKQSSGAAVQVGSRSEGVHGHLPDKRAQAEASDREWNTVGPSLSSSKASQVLGVAVNAEDDRSLAPDRGRDEVLGSRTASLGSAEPAPLKGGTADMRSEVGKIPDERGGGAGGASQGFAAATHVGQVVDGDVEEADRDEETAAMLKVLEEFVGGRNSSTCEEDEGGRERGGFEVGGDSFVIVNFYHLTHVEHPVQLRKEAEVWLRERDIRGRIYVSSQGINAQYSGPSRDADAFAEWIKGRPGFQALRWSSERVEGHQFPRLRLKFRESLVQLAGGTTSLPITNPEERATPLSPAAWKEMLRSAVAPRGAGSDAGGSSGSPEGAAAEGTQPPAPASPGPLEVVVLDVRNGYEWDAGHFVGATRPLEDQFKETPTDARPQEAEGIEGDPLHIPQQLQGRDPDTPVMMYCTGGIRCDIYSAYLRRKGFQNLYTLEGGVHNYFRQEGGDLWNGSLFVFDGRMAVGPDASLPAATACTRCRSPAHLPHMNCSNIDCNQLFIACAACKVECGGCCSEECRNAPRLLRPLKTDGQYGEWHEYRSCAQDAARIAEGRGSGRAARRRKRIEKFRERSAAERAVRAERRLLGKVAPILQEDTEGNAEEEGTKEEDEKVEEEKAAMAAREAERAACEESGEAGYRGQSSTVPMEVSGEGGETQTGTVTHFGTPAGSPTPSDGDTAPAISREKAKRTRRPLQLFPCDKLY